MEAISEEVDSYIGNSNELRIYESMELHQQLIKRIDELTNEIAAKEDKLRKLNILEENNSMISILPFRSVKLELDPLLREAIENLFVDVCRNTIE